MPEMTPAYAVLSDLLNFKLEATTTLLVAIDPVVDPAPTLRVPSETVRAPLNEFAPDNVSCPWPILVSPNAPEIGPEMVPSV